MLHKFPRYHFVPIVIIAIALAMMFGGSALAQFFENVDAMDGRWLIANAPISSSSPTDSMDASTVLLGERRWGLGINNHYNQTFTNPKIAISTSLSSASFEGGVTPVGTSASSLGPNSAISLEVKTSSSAPPALLTFTPGFDSSQTVSPLVIPPGGTSQTMTIKVTPRDSRYFASLNDPPSGIQLGFGGNIQSVTVPTNLTPGVENLFGSGNFWTLNNPQKDKEYTFTVVLLVDNQTGSPIVSKPGSMVQMMVYSPLNGTRARSVTIHDGFLDGDIVYSLDQEVNWNSVPQDNYQIGYPAFSGPAPTDTTPPVITAPNIIAEATSPSGAAVIFSPTATDDIDGTDPVTCDAASGATFPLGVTTVHCTATDQAGNAGSATFTITVQDTTPPTINCPSNMTVFQNSAYGAIVTFAPTASDTVSAITTSCTPASGSNFPLGTTSVQCTATDASGNKSPSCSFTVTVVPPPSSIGVKSTDGGSIPIPGGIGTFGIVAMASSTGFVKGDVEYQDHVTGMNLKSTMITAIVVDGTHARIFGKAMINGSGSYDFVIDVDDLGEPGIGSDKFGIQVSNGYTAGPSKLSGGNIQIHN
jgi:hypothetical protein